MRAFIFLAALSLASCAGMKWKPEAVRTQEPLIQRGWSYIESEKDFLAQEAGAAQVSYSGPQIAGSRLVFGSDRFGITVLVKQSGQLLWQKRLEDGVAAQPLVHQSNIFVGSESGQLHLFQLESGLETWSIRLSAPVEGSLLYASERLFVATADEALHAVDPQTGKILWTYRRPAFGGTGIRGGHHPAMVAGRIWMGFSDGALVALDPNDGSVQLEKQFRDNLKFIDVDARVVGWKDGVLVATYDGKLRYLRRDGAQLWEFPAGGSRAALVGDGDKIYFPSSDGNIYAIDGDSGKELWRYSLRRGVPTGIALVNHGKGKSLIGVASDEKVFALDTLNGSLVSQLSLGRGSGSFSPIAVDEESRMFYVLSSYSRVHQFRLPR
jgi:outer membrane protein assembly factor BamB